MCMFFSSELLRFDFKWSTRSTVQSLKMNFMLNKIKKIIRLGKLETMVQKAVEQTQGLRYEMGSNRSQMTSGQAQPMGETD